LFVGDDVGLTVCVTAGEAEGPVTSPECVAVGFGLTAVFPDTITTFGSADAPAETSVTELPVSAGEEPSLPLTAASVTFSGSVTGLTDSDTSLVYCSETLVVLSVTELSISKSPGGLTCEPR
jgi:hypothetical protein